MFIYENKNTEGAEVLNICFQSTQIPVETADVRLWKDADEKVHVVVGEKELTE